MTHSEVAFHALWTGLGRAALGLNPCLSTPEKLTCRLPPTPTTDQLSKCGRRSPPCDGVTVCGGAAQDTTTIDQSWGGPALPGVRHPGPSHNEKRHQVDSNPGGQQPLHAPVKLLGSKGKNLRGCPPVKEAACRGGRTPGAQHRASPEQVRPDLLLGSAQPCSLNDITGTRARFLSNWLGARQWALQATTSGPGGRCQVC